MALDILVVDDEADIRDLISGILDDEGYETRTAKDSDTALAEIEARRPSLIILDIWLQGSRLDGLEILKVIKKMHEDLPVIIISGHGNIETAVAAIKYGAYDFISKPFETDKLLILVERATEVDKLRRENTELKEKMGFDVGLTGSSSAINLVRNTIDKVAPSGSRVLISGPSGSGKEVVARLIHKQSKRAKGSFVVINAASISPDNMESELFGVEEDGLIKKTGVFEQAHGGTLFIDEVADMPQNTQAKILRILTDQTFERVGSNKKVLVNVRVISATSKDLREQINNNLFREDLFHRLSVVPVRVPPLIQRREDIPALVGQIMGQLAAGTGVTPKNTDPDAMAALQAHEWPGNVRQLRNVVERLLIMSADSDTITIDMLPSEIVSDVSVVRPSMNNDIMSLPLRDAREKFEREYLKVQVRRFNGNISRTAEYVGMERSALHRKLKNLGLAGSDKNNTE
ncbi:sigma-54-dependent transcriptional regulator [Paremcibacter congregatus]|uniref:Sigma-54-dependent Fis family transcriptional regulator n=1 Tax=Paremcibacter congregatus TaxID=2043170 RepID=A0A2G4YV02_9PROT|nr:sigma-54 dependent transcriptional regulator [Paremcibacter congregatus]PHZ86158.1 sigma-54-dependent Fis family transcriptional regulator [Paremcibacter congregatus]QDE27121.1 sigma-54-dependent Fis family transcriptional regulator [Paremcibacter congregatus]|tara:strand:+ start:956 stop:2335 length:1380 start_codon:yes stop_codon:yes gene_type:complete